MTHQEHIAHVLAAALALPTDTLAAFCRGNPFDKLLRSHDEFNAAGKPLYRRDLAAKHYRMSRKAYDSGLPARALYGEHRIPLNLIKGRLLRSDGQLESVREILRSNEVVLLMPCEQESLDRSVKKGGLSLRNRLGPNDADRLECAGIEIAPETLDHRL